MTTMEADATRTARRVVFDRQAGRPPADQDIRPDRRTPRLRHVVVSGIARLRIAVGRRLHAGQHHEAEARQLHRVDLCARRLHLPPRPAVAAGAVRRSLHPRPRRQPCADGRRRSRPHIRKAGAGDARLPRRHHQGRGRFRQLADRHRRTRPADAEAVREPHPRRASLQHHAAAHGRGRTHPGPEQVAGGRAEGYARNRSGEGARARAQGAVALHGARQLPQQLAAHRLLRGGAGERRLRPLHRRDGAVGHAPTRCARACARISPPARRRSASSRCTRTATPPRATAS